MSHARPLRPTKAAPGRCILPRPPQTSAPLPVSSRVAECALFGSSPLPPSASSRDLELPALLPPCSSSALRRPSTPRAIRIVSCFRSVGLSPCGPSTSNLSERSNVSQSSLMNLLIARDAPSAKPGVSPMFGLLGVRYGGGRNLTANTVAFFSTIGLQPVGGPCSVAETICAGVLTCILVPVEAYRVHGGLSPGRRAYGPRTVGTGTSRHSGSVMASFGGDKTRMPSCSSRRPDTGLSRRPDPKPNSQFPFLVLPLFV